MDQKCHKKWMCGFKELHETKAVRDTMQVCFVFLHVCSCFRRTQEQSLIPRLQHSQVSGKTLSPPCSSSPPLSLPVRPRTIFSSSSPLLLFVLVPVPPRTLLSFCPPPSPLLAVPELAVPCPLLFASKNSTRPGRITGHHAGIGRHHAGIA